jgi:hypothetical protein
MLHEEGGDLGWPQITNFLTTELLVIAGAVGIQAEEELE